MKIIIATLCSSQLTSKYKCESNLWDTHYVRPFETAYFLNSDSSFLQPMLWLLQASQAKNPGDISPNYAAGEKSCIMIRYHWPCVYHCMCLFPFQIVAQFGESASFGGVHVAPAVDSCFSQVRCFDFSFSVSPLYHGCCLLQAWSPAGITEDEFLSWVYKEPQTLVWLPTFHRMAAAETGLCLAIALQWCFMFWSMPSLRSWSYFCLFFGF